MAKAYDLGDSVQVSEGVYHPGFHLPLSGWQGHVIDVIDVEGQTYLAVQWDSQTLQEMPPGMAQFSLDADWEWRGWIFTTAQVQPALPRNENAETIAQAAKVAATLRQEFRQAGDGQLDVAVATLLENEDEEFFDLPLFLTVLNIPEAEHEAVKRALAAGAGTYYYQHYGHWRYGRRPFFLIPLLMAKAPTFGYGVLAVLADDEISLDSRKKIAYFACQTADPFAPDHMPHGLISFVSFLAQHNGLSVELFRSALLALELADVQDKLMSWSLGEAQSLTAWLVAETAVPDTEKLWWLWYLSAYLPPTLGKRLLPVWLAHPHLPLDLRRELAWGWLMGEEQLGVPPANWRLMAATFAGDTEEAETAAAEMNLVEATQVDEQAVMEDLQRTPHIVPMPDHHGPGNDPVGFLAMLMGMRFGRVRGHPPFVRRYAIQAVAELEQNPLELFQMVLAESDAHNEVLRHGVIDALPAYAARFTAVQKRQLLDMGLIVGKADLRQRIYELGVQWLGDNYLQEALADPAKSIRDWAMAHQKKN